MMMKKKVLIVGLGSLIVFFVIYFLSQKYGCKEDLFFFCKDAYSWFVYLFSFFPMPLVFFSLITYKMHEKIFNAWLKFVYVWIPLTLVLVFLSPEYDSSMIPMTKGLVSFLMSTVFLFISLIIIIIMYFRAGNKRKVT